MLWIFEILSFQFLAIVFRKFQIHHCEQYLWWNQKPHLSGKLAHVEWNGVKFGTPSQSYKIWGTFYLVAFNITLESVVGVISSAKMRFPKHYLVYKLQPKFIKLLPNFRLNGPHKSTFGIFEILKIEILAFFFHFG